METKNRIDELECFRCEYMVKRPKDYEGNIYELLVEHYKRVHKIDLKDKNDRKKLKSDPPLNSLDYIWPKDRQ